MIGLEEGSGLVPLTKNFFSLVCVGCVDTELSISLPLVAGGQMGFSVRSLDVGCDGPRESIIENSEKSDGSDEMKLCGKFEGLSNTASDGENDRLVVSGAIDGMFEGAVDVGFVVGNVDGAIDKVFVIDILFHEQA